eukprot:COSAG01_NODE_1896_length_8969_cov_35.725028_13_plen_65_part_00
MDWLPVNLLFIAMLMTGFLRCAGVARIVERGVPRAVLTGPLPRRLPAQLETAGSTHGDDIQESD